MVIYSDEMATSVTAATTLTEMTGSPYSPKKTGRLLQVKLTCGGDAVTTLIHMVVAELTNPEWGVPVYVATAGADLMTAPAHPIPQGVQDVDLPVTIGSQITVKIKNETGATPVTPRYSIIGVFEG